mmetsp:Transcript_14486/g.31494  ORF Transcript_14486/g.31494 Transcript_14486/m.31494 type:complete len:237 (-) Transcript_14486:172-882(-)
MSDDEDWESFSVPTFAAPAATAAATSIVLPSSNLDGDEEEDLTLLEQPTTATPSASQQEAARKKAALEAEALASRVEFALLENETPEEKKVRELRQAQEAEARMVANDLGGSAAAPATKVSAVTGIAAIPLKNKKDHETFAITVANKLGGSTSVCATAFMAELTNRVKANITTEGLDALLANLQAVRDSRKKVEQVTNKKSKKEILKEQKAHADKYGGADEDDYYDSYAALEDDFM